MRRAALVLASLPLLLAADDAVPELAMPIACKLGESCVIQHYVDVDPTAGVRDYHCGARTYDGHDGIDFRLRSMKQQRAGVKVLAAADGTVLSMRDAMPDISVAVAGQSSVAGRECGNGVVIDHGHGVQTQYCHMARGSIAVKPRQVIKVGEPLGLVGMSGNAEFPHLHFIVRRRGQAVDPFGFGAAPGQCGAGRSLWRAASALAQSYRAGEVLNVGFATGAMTMEAVQENGDDQQPRPTRDGPALVAFVQAIGLEGGDVQTLRLAAPDGTVLAENRMAPLDRNKAQTIMFVGKKRGVAPWSSGRYVASYAVLRARRVVIERRFSIVL